MSVLARLRNVSKVQFLTTLAELLKEVEAWCIDQGPKNQPYVIDLYKDVRTAFNYAEAGNLLPMYTKDDAKERKKMFKAAIRKLHEFNTDLVCTAATHNISNSKVKRWSAYSDKAINLIEAVIRSDFERAR